jgi:adenine phosphoribosyltransferase
VLPALSCIRPHTICQGGSAKAAGELVAKLEGKTLEYMFIAEIKFLEGSSKLDAPTYSVIQVEDEVED